MAKQLCRIGLRRCHICKLILPLNFDYFYHSNSKGTFGYATECKECCRIRSRKAKRRRNTNSKRKNKNEFIDIIGYIYVLKCNEFYKIGRSTKNNFNSRIQALQGGNPYKLELIHKYKSETSIDEEYWLHQRFKTKRGLGEWFKLDKKDIEYLLSLKTHNE